VGYTTNNMIWVGSRLKAQLQQERIALKPHFKGFLQTLSSTSSEVLTWFNLDIFAPMAQKS
jgi:hypothetical protein